MSLSPDDFEALVADLLSQEWKTRLESFKTGKDRGIDLRNSRVPASDSATIVQCKRYAPENFAALLSAIKKELRKIERLRPARYVLATSTRLSPDNKDKLVAALHPWSKGPQDIYGPDELNGLLRSYPTVESAHFKLWISSITVLEQVLHSKIFALTASNLEETQRQLSRLVVHEGMDRALDLLRQRHHVLIVGDPGIGKSTLARMLMCHYIRDEFEPIWVSGSIDDAWDVVHGARARERRLVIVYDDFLGRFKYDSHRFGKNEDSSLMTLLDKVARSDNLRFIMSTREYILEDARRLHGLFDGRADELLRCTLSLKDYTRAHRAKMLFNHLFFSDLPDSRLQALVEARTYEKIIAHEHFNPRIVESICTHANSRSLSDQAFLKFMEQEFDNPAKLWDHPFKVEISPQARQVLGVLWTYRGSARLADVEEAIHRLNPQAPAGELSLAIEHALRQLDGNFIRTSRCRDGASVRRAPILTLQFANASVEEYVDHFMGENVTWLAQLAEVGNCMRQIEILSGKARMLENRQPISRSFWTRLRTLAASCETLQELSLINLKLHGEEESQPSWYPSDANLADTTLEVLNIDRVLGSNDERYAAVIQRVLTVEGWLTLLQPLCQNDSTDRSVHDLQSWIVCGDWPEAVRAQAQECLRTALIHYLNGEPDFYVNLYSIMTVIEAATLKDPPLTVEQRTTLVNCVIRHCERMIDEESDADVLREQADVLKALGQLLRCDFSADQDRITERADDIEELEKPPRTKSRADERRYGGREEELDLDDFFKGLRER